MLSGLSSILNSDQMAMAKLIVSEFKKANLPANVACAAIVNAWHESRLNPKAAGDNGQSIGLFQLYSKGAGHGMSVSERENPRKNAQRIIEVVKKKWSKFEPVLGSISECVKVFTIYVEIPANKHVRANERAVTSLEFFPTDTAEYDNKALVALLFTLSAGISFASCYYINKL